MEKIVCPDCNGLGIIQLFNSGIIECPTCEGEGELPAIPATNWCPACGEPIPERQKWCEFHKEVEKFQ